MEEDVVALAAQAATIGGDPLGALTALAELRSRLDEVEREQVRLAVEDGWSWAAVADALGISRQAAHKKHRDRVAKPRSRPATVTRQRILVTSEARSAVRNAREEAARTGHRQVGTEHLLLGILRCEYSVAVRALATVGVSLDLARDAVLPTLPGNGAGGSGDGGSVISDAARSALEQSLREATRRGDGYLGVEHLLLALVRDPGSGAARTLQALDADRKKVRQAVDSLSTV